MRRTAKYANLEDLMNVIPCLDEVTAEYIRINPIKEDVFELW